MKNILIIIALLWALEGSGQIYIDSYRFGAAPAAGLLLDNYPAQAAYSLRKLRTAYTGDCLVVRKASTGDTLAIGWDGNYVDTAAIVTFCTGTTCTVRRWYDQSGNGNDVVQATTAAQPTIFSGGAILTRGTKKAIKGDGGDLMSAAFTRNQPHAAMYVGTIVSGDFGMDAAAGVNDASMYNDANRIRISANTGASYSEIILNANPANYSLISALYNGASSRVDLNTSSATGSIGTNAAGGVTIFTSQLGILSNAGFTQEVIIWTSNNTSDWANIQADINSFYSIY